MAIVHQNDIAGKICVNPECGWKPLSEFAPARSFGLPVGDGYKSRCRVFWNAQKRDERAANPEKHHETARKYVKENKEHIRNLKPNTKQKTQKDIMKLFVSIARYIVKTSIQKPRNVAIEISNIIEKSAVNHMNGMLMNGENTPANTTNVFLKNQSQRVIVAVP